MNQKLSKKREISKKIKQNKQKLFGITLRVKENTFVLKIILKIKNELLIKTKLKKK